MEGVNRALNLANYDVVTLEQVRARLHPLVANLDSLMREMNMNPETPLGWTVLQRHITTFKSQLKSMYDFLHTPIKQDGTDVTTPAMLLTTLHPHPIPPFPAISPNGYHFLNSAVARKMSDMDEVYIKDAVSHAAAFCRVEGAWDIDHLKDDEKRESYEGMERAKTDFNEDQVTEVWKLSAQNVAELLNVFTLAVKGVPGELELDEAELQRIEEVRYAVEGDEEEEGESPEAGEEAKDMQATEADQPLLPVSKLLQFVHSGEVKA